MEAIAAGRSSSIPADELRALIAEVRELDRRVSALERKESSPSVVLSAELAAPEHLEVPSDALPMTGFALLGIAGAYLLRALSELGTLPRGLGVTLGICYAGMWLWLAAGASAARKFAMAARVSTAVLIFAPLVWESTVRFQTLSAWVAASVVWGFCAAAEAVSWRKTLKTIASVVPAACAVLALALSIGTYALAPFALALLAIAATVEFAAVRDRATGTRWLVAVCADAAVLMLAVLMRDPHGLPEGYAPVSMASAAAIQGLLLVIYASSAIARNVLRGREFTIPEIVQTVLAYLLGVGGIVAIAGLRLPAGVFALLTGAAAYAYLAARLGNERNRRIYATVGLALIASAAWLILSGSALIGAWSALAVGAVFWNSDRLGDAHAAVLLWLAMLVSQVAGGSAEEFFAGGGSFPAGDAAIVVFAAALSYLGVRRRIPACFIAAGLAWASAGVIASLLRFPGSGTIALVLTAVALAWIGAKWHRRELVWLMYPFMTVAGLRIVWRDFPSDKTIDLVAPLLLFGAALILLPRLLQSKGEPAANIPPHR